MDNQVNPPGNHLRAWRKRAGLTLRECAERLDTGLHHLHAIEKGKRVPYYLLAWRIEKLTGIPMQAWAERAEELAA